MGATLYYDGANLNAVMGYARPGDMGFDIVHFNLHKTFTQPHGGGGPGAGPIAVSDRIEPYLPRPQVVRHASGNGAGPAFDLDDDRPKSIGRLRGFQGNFGVFVRSYAYILLARRRRAAGGVRDRRAERQLPAGAAGARRRASTSRPRTTALCMHEFVLTGGPMKKALGIRTLDLAKRLLDFGFHPPTVYFPLLVDEALLIEPTETETRETLDAFADAIGEILARGGGGSGDRAQRALHHAGAAARRGRRGEAAGHPPAAVARNAARRSASAAISASWRASIGANGSTSTRPSATRHARTRSRRPARRVVRDPRRVAVGEDPGAVVVGEDRVVEHREEADRGGRVRVRQRQPGTSNSSRPRSSRKRRSRGARRANSSAARSSPTRRGSHGVAGPKAAR